MATFRRREQPLRKENVKIENNEREIAMSEDRLLKVVGLVADVFCTTKMRSTRTDIYMSSLSVQFGALLNLLS